MDKTDLLVGLDIGTTSVKAVVADTASNEMQIIGAANGPTKGMRHGKIVDIDQTAESISAVLKKVAQKTNSKKIVLIPFVKAIVTDVSIKDKKVFINKECLVIPISQSGETADTLEALKLTKNHNCDSLGIINVKESSIARICNNVLYIEAGPEIAVATTKAYLAQVLVLTLIAIYLGRKYNNLKYGGIQDMNTIAITFTNIKIKG